MLNAVCLRKRATPRLSNSFDVGTSQADCTSRGVSLGRFCAIIAADIRRVERYSSFHAVYLHRGEPPVHTDPTHKECTPAQPLVLTQIAACKRKISSVPWLCLYAESHSRQNTKDVDLRESPASRSTNKGLDRLIRFSVFYIYDCLFKVRDQKLEIHRPSKVTRTHN